MASTYDSSWISNGADGPLRTRDAATRSSFCADRQRAKTASAIKVSGMPRSQAEIDGPLAGPFLAGGVEDQVDHRLLGLGVDVAEDIAGDLDQVAVERPLVPAVEDVVHGGWVQAEQPRIRW